MRLDQAKKEDNKFTTEKLTKRTPSPGEKKYLQYGKDTVCKYQNT